MSIINRMLQDLDRRDAMGEPGEEPVQQQVRAVPRAGAARREWFWRILAVLLLAGVGWVGWVAWQLQPRALVATEEALKVAARLKPPAPVVAATPAPQAASPAPKPEVVPSPSAPEPSTPAAASEPVPPAPAPAAPASAGKPEAAKSAAASQVPGQAARPAESLKLAEPIKTPISEQPRAPAAQRKESRAAAGPPKARPSANETSAGTAEPGASGPPANAAKPPAKIEVDVPPARVLPAPRSTARVQKQDRVLSPEERAESEFRRGVGLLNQGRVSEAEELFAAALAASHTHEAARQALVALRLEQKRLEDARRLLQEGLAVNPGNLQFATVLARLHVERRDYPAALETLNGIHTSQNASPEVAFLRATALQRLGRNAEAVEAFQSALRGTPQSGPAWLGLAISLEALGKTTDAADAYHRAAGSASLGTEVRAYAEQRARQLR